MNTYLKYFTINFGTYIFWQKTEKTSTISLSPSSWIQYFEKKPVINVLNKVQMCHSNSQNRLWPLEKTTTKTSCELLTWYNCSKSSMSINCSEENPQNKLGLMAVSSTVWPYLLIAHCVTQTTCGGAAHARLGGHSLTLKLGRIGCNNPLWHHHWGQRCIGSRPDYCVALRGKKKTHTELLITLQCTLWPLDVSRHCISDCTLLTSNALFVLNRWTVIKNGNWYQSIQLCWS